MEGQGRPLPTLPPPRAPVLLGPCARVAFHLPCRRLGLFVSADDTAQPVVT